MIAVNGAGYYTEEYGGCNCPMCNDSEDEQVDSSPTPALAPAADTYDEYEFQPPF